MEDTPKKEDAPKKVVKPAAPAADTPAPTPPKTAKPKRRWLFVLQLLGGYLVAAWTLLQFLEWFLRRNEISPYWVDLFLWVFIGVIPTLLYYFYHKNRIDDRQLKWKDRFLFGGNFLLLGLALFLGFYSADLGATTKEISYVDANGVDQKKTIVKQQFRKGVSVYDFADERQDSVSGWLVNGIRKLLVLDLQQDNHLVTAAGAGQLTAAEKLIPGEADNYFVDGSFRLTEATYSIIPQIKRANTGKLLATRTFSGNDLLDLLDSISVFVRQSVGLTEEQITSTADLPLREYTSTSPAAIKKFSQGYFYRQLERALEIDSTFALAALELGRGLYRMEHSKRDAKYYLGLAFRHRGKLPLELRYELLSYWYLSLGEFAAAEEALQLQLDISPQNATLNQTMVNIYERTRQLDKLVAFTGDWATRDFSGLSGSLHARTLLLRAETDKLLQAADAANLIYPNAPLITFYQFKAHLTAGDWDVADKKLRSMELTLPEYQQQFDLLRSCLEYQREKGEALTINQNFVGKYRKLNNDFTAEVFNLPQHQRALALQDDNMLALLLASGEEEAVVAYSSWAGVDRFTIIKTPSGEVSRLEVNARRGENTRGSKMTYWAIPAQVAEAEAQRKTGNYPAAITAYRKALEAYPEHYYLADWITHLEYLQATPPEKLQKQLASVVGTYQERNFTLENGRLFYKRQDLDEKSNNYYRKLELLPISATHYISPERLVSRMAFDYRNDGQVASYSELYDQEKGGWYTNENAEDYKLRDEESESR